ncbi:hypothetical protein [Microcoleus sp. herbarium14]|uniref:hypothetical protein n=1 Tax=Microcoleus sp. herbarium14 TaxID=3055439 RepID=UPI002FD4BF2E
MPKLSKMKVISGAGTGTSVYIFRTNSLLYAQISATVGITALEVADAAIPISRIEDLILYGILETLTVTVGTTPATRRSVNILCDAEIAEVAKIDLKGKPIPQGIITSVSEGLKAEVYI